jgi:hypothetical protein
MQQRSIVRPLSAVEIQNQTNNHTNPDGFQYNSDMDEFPVLQVSIVRYIEIVS